jgi:hypothetical protein
MKVVAEWSERELVEVHPKIKRMYGSIRSQFCDCHFCGKRIKTLHKYIQLTQLKYIYLAHVGCYAIYVFEHPEPAAGRGDFARWSKEGYVNANMGL